MHQRLPKQAQPPFSQLPLPRPVSSHTKRKTAVQDIQLTPTLHAVGHGVRTPCTHERVTLVSAGWLLSASASILGVLPETSCIGIQEAEKTIAIAQLQNVRQQVLTRHFDHWKLLTAKAETDGTQLPHPVSSSAPPCLLEHPNTQGCN